MNGKGSKQRPLLIDPKVFDKRWRDTFKKKKCIIIAHKGLNFELAGDAWNTLGNKA